MTDKTENLIKFFRDYFSNLKIVGKGLDDFQQWEEITTSSLAGVGNRATHKFPKLTEEFLELAEEKIDYWKLWDNVFSYQPISLKIFYKFKHKLTVSQFQTCIAKNKNIPYKIKLLMIPEAYTSNSIKLSFEGSYTRLSTLIGIPNKSISNVVIYYGTKDIIRKDLLSSVFFHDLNIHNIKSILP